MLTFWIGRLACRCSPVHSFQSGMSVERGERKERKITKENPRWCVFRYLLEMFKLAEYWGYVRGTRYTGH